MSELESFGTGAGLAGAGIYAVKKAIDGLDRVFGPLTDEVADAMKRWAAHQLRNVGRVTENAEKKSTREAIETGTIPLRAAAKILEEAASADETVIVDYLGGVLASSRTSSGRDDRGVTFSATISRLSSYDLRAHYVFYSTMRTVLLGSELNVFDAPEVALKARVFIPIESLLRSMDLEVDDESLNIIYGSIYSLKKEELLDLTKFGPIEHLRQDYPLVSEPGIIVSPTPVGTYLFLWAHGRGNHPPAALTDAALELPALEESIPAVSDACATHSLQPAS